MSVARKVRDLVSTYEERVAKLTKEYHEELEYLQAQCPHDRTTPWQYTLDTYGRIATNQDGILYKTRECLHCGKLEKILDDELRYDSEIPFNL